MQEVPSVFRFFLRKFTKRAGVVTANRQLDAVGQQKVAGKIYEITGVARWNTVARINFWQT
jgi:hypothetical protein